jgi:hypothetical protein
MNTPKVNHDLPPRIPDIKIIDLDVSATKPSPLGENRRVFRFKLSARPPAMWPKFFDEAREKPRRGYWRPAEIKEVSIVTDCIPDEIAEWHLDDLKNDVKTANEKYSAFCDAAERAARIKEEQKFSEKEKLESLRSRLKFD